MKKITSLKSGKALIFLMGLAFAAALAAAVVWASHFNQNETPAQKIRVAKRMKIPQVPTAKRMKVPQLPSPVNKPASTVPVQPQASELSFSETPATEASLPQAALSQPSVKAHLVEPRAPLDPAETPTGKDRIVAPNRETDGPSSPLTTEMAAQQDETHDVSALPERHEPTRPAQDVPAEGNSVQEAVVQAPPHQETATDAAVSAPSDSAEIQPVLNEDPASAPFNLQVGAYRVEAYANETVAKITKKGYNAFIVKIADTRQNTWYTVRLGRFKTREEAASSLDRFMQKEKINAVIARSEKL